MTAVSRETRNRLGRLEVLVRAEQSRQNLVSAGTLEAFETRHIIDSLQLVPLIGEGALIDIGSGGGFPGLVLACCTSSVCNLIEPRSKRADFLRSAAGSLGLSNVEVFRCAVQRVEMPPVATITARAVASLEKLFEMAFHLADPDTRWVLPKGRSAKSELEAARQSWQGRFELVPSQTDPESGIVVAHDIRRRRQR